MLHEKHDWMVGQLFSLAAYAGTNDLDASYEALLDAMMTTMAEVDIQSNEAFHSNVVNRRDPACWQRRSG